MRQTASIVRCTECFELIVSMAVDENIIVVIVQRRSRSDQLNAKCEELDKLGSVIMAGSICSSLPAGKTQMNGPWLKTSFYLMTIYFYCMAAAHFFGLKYPLLFVYYDVPSNAYQDRIIAFSVVAFASLFYVAARHRIAAPTALYSLAVAVLGLASVNVSDALQISLHGAATTAYWVQTVWFGMVWLWLFVLYLREKPRSRRFSFQ